MWPDIPRFVWSLSSVLLPSPLVCLSSHQFCAVYCYVLVSSKTECMHGQLIPVYACYSVSLNIPLQFLQRSPLGVPQDHRTPQMTLSTIVILTIGNIAIHRDTETAAVCCVSVWLPLWSLQDYGVFSVLVFFLHDTHIPEYFLSDQSWVELS